MPTSAAAKPSFREAILNVATEDLLQNGKVAPHFVGTNGEELVVLPLDGSRFQDDDYKDGVCEYWREVALDNGITEYALVSEVWVAALSTDPRLRALRVGQRSDRREMVMMIGGTKELPLFSIREILRDSSGKPTGLGPEESDGDVPDSPFVGLLESDS